MIVATVNVYDSGIKYSSNSYYNGNIPYAPVLGWVLLIGPNGISSNPNSTLESMSSVTMSEFTTLLNSFTSYQSNLTINIYLPPLQNMGMINDNPIGFGIGLMQGTGVTYNVYSST